MRSIRISISIFLSIIMTTLMVASVSAATPKPAEKTLYAKYVPHTVTITFNANGHGTAPAEQTYTYGTTGTLPTMSNVSGYTFKGWAASSSATIAEFSGGGEQHNSFWIC